MRGAVNDAIPHDSAKLRWSDAEKKIARRAFEKALQLELGDVVQETKRRAEIISSSDDAWDLAVFLTERRKHIDREYDYRYSVLPDVFAGLILKGRLREEDLQGLGQDKVEYVQRLLRLARHRK
jgi:hypothetical protein